MAALTPTPYLDRLRGENEKKNAPPRTAKTAKTNLRSFCSSPPGVFQSHFSPAPKIQAPKSSPKNRQQEQAKEHGLGAIDRYRVTTWLDQIGEPDPQARAQYLAACSRAPKALAWTLRELAAAPAPAPKPAAAPKPQDQPEPPALTEAKAKATEAHRLYLDHLMRAPATGCGCCTNLGALQARFCPDGARLREAYVQAARDAEPSR
ncbi:hypothetical protein Thi970DRAFT_04478 [Thiorhodovibrio frisius]|uniref:Uncharacterized protein n=1 Tax=Thiorhodovibrio frisius TaxID=631362 RepID=H8Z715_9GAMM|nr:hypothetical protein Thi970DRAFT_04478 [Thiorhodovibrio frisius]WPL21866.1 hypothetical protein Thiofri_02003 [Thiorhodovibrio frisius]